MIRVIWDLYVVDLIDLCDLCIISLNLRDLYIVDLICLTRASFLASLDSPPTPGHEIPYSGCPLVFEHVACVIYLYIVSSGLSHACKIFLLSRIPLPPAAGTWKTPWLPGTG